jgi:hypothetical protein
MDRHDHLAPHVVLYPMSGYCWAVLDSQKSKGDDDGRDTRLRGGWMTRWEAMFLRHVSGAAGSEEVHAPR